MLADKGDLNCNALCRPPLRRPYLALKGEQCHSRDNSPHCWQSSRNKDAKCHGGSTRAFKTLKSLQRDTHKNCQCIHSTDHPPSPKTKGPWLTFIAGTNEFPPPMLERLSHLLVEDIQARSQMMEKEEQGLSPYHCKQWSSAFFLRWPSVANALAWASQPILGDCDHNCTIWITINKETNLNFQRSQGHHTLQ